MLNNGKQQTGFSLLEALVAILVSSIILGAASMLFNSAMNTTQLMLTRAEMQQDARSAVNIITKDLSLAGTTMPVGGLQLPAGAGATPSLHGCSGGVCYLHNSNFGAANRLYYAWPDPGDNNVQQGTPDAITIAYTDRSISLGSVATKAGKSGGADISASGAQVRMNNSTAGVNIGDLIMFTNVHGSALGLVTNVTSATNILEFAANDPLNINQPGAATGNIASLQDPGTNTYPATTAARVLIISYYVRQRPGPDSTFGTDDDVWQLMRQVGNQPPSAVMDGIDNLQFTYDLYDDTSDNPGTTLKTNTKDANGTPNLIRKVNLVLSARSPRRAGPSKNFSYITLALSVSPRNLSFRDRYK